MTKQGGRQVKYLSYSALLSCEDVYYSAQGGPKFLVYLKKNPYGVTIKTKAIQQYFNVVLFAMLYKVALTCECVDRNPRRDHSDESYRIIKRIFSL